MLLLFTAKDEFVVPTGSVFERLRIRLKSKEDKIRSGTNRVCGQADLIERTLHDPL